jgi:hypothetical protein
MLLIFMLRDHKRRVTDRPFSSIYPINISAMLNVSQEYYYSMKLEDQLRPARESSYCSHPPFF